MRFVIVGCGRVGSLLATQLDASGHAVTVIDADPDSFDYLPDSFDGQRVAGHGHDRAILRKARIEDAYALAAMSNDDNTNIIAARTAADHFHVPHVVARIADPNRARLYERLGIPTVSSAELTAHAALYWMLPPTSEVLWEDDTARANLVEARPVERWAGVPITAVEDATGGKVVLVSRRDKLFFPTDRTVVQENDILTIATLNGGAGEVRDVLSSPPVWEEE